MRWIDAKLAGIGVTGHTGYKICYQYCHYAMITVRVKYMSEGGCNQR